MVMNVIEVKNVQRVYETSTGIWKRERKQVDAVKDVSFEVKKGEIFGLLGPNGAGKTTIIKMLTTMLIPSGGSLSVLGLDPIKQFKTLRPRINFILGGERNLYWRLTAYDNLAYFADLYKIPRKVQEKRLPELLKLVELEEFADHRVETFSKGMKQRLQIARGLLNEPEILFLDEPSIGLDPVSARKLREIITELRNTGTTILLTTHYMFEADDLCDRIAFIKNGRLIAIDTPKNLKSRTEHISVIDCRLAKGTRQDIESLFNEKELDDVVFHVEENGLHIRILTRHPQRIVPLLYSLSNGEIQDLTVTKPTLEDVYVSLIEEAAK
jgi:ABC-2 type transport system ATP-binding protein